MHQDYPIVDVSQCSIWGPTCDGLDRVIDLVNMPKMNMGDWIIFEDMGAYTLPLACTFNGFPVPKVFSVIDLGIWLVFFLFDMLIFFYISRSVIL